MIVTPEQRVYFRGEFRSARADAQRNAEDFHAVVVVLERFGAFLSGGGVGLKDYESSIADFIRTELGEAALFSADPAGMDFHDLYAMVRTGRNDAVHGGAFARNLAAHAGGLAVILEDALMSRMEKVRNYMVRSPVCAELWHPLASVRQAMLSNVFSYLPVLVGDEDENGQKWMLVSDHAVARFLRPLTNGRRRAALAATLESVANAGEITFEEPYRVFADAPVSAIFERNNGKPVLVFEPGDDAMKKLVGLVMPFDLL